MTTPFAVVRRTSSAAEFHGLGFPEPMSAQVWIHQLTAPALVLGSTQHDDVVDHDACRRDGVDVVRRRSGGGAVFLAPGEVTWIDVLVPTTVSWWSSDIHVAMVWLGEHLAAAMTDAGVDDVDVHRGSLVTTNFSRLVCFDGLGAGEVTVGGDKLVGISQRRARDGARLQACWYSTHHHQALLEYLIPAVDPERLGPVATVTEGVSHSVVDSLAERLTGRLAGESGD